MKIALENAALSTRSRLFSGPEALLNDIRSGSRLLYGLGLAHFALALVFVPGLMLDERLITGVNPWIKPFKFAVSIAIYLWTFAWVLNATGDLGRRRGLLVWTAAATMIVEMFVITLQPLRGTTSHYNISTPLNAVLWTAMGQAIAVNTLANIYLLYLLTRRKFLKAQIAREPLLAWGLRLGMFVFIVGAVEGGVMGAMARHSIGVADGGPGLPLVNWSTRGGDLRIAHFLGIHAMQGIPLFAWLLHARGARKAWPVFAFAGTWLGLTTALFIQALMGRPLIAF